MSKTDNEFFLMRQEEEGHFYVPTYAKKEVKQKAIEEVERILDGGHSDLAEAFADVTRLKEYLSTFETELKKHIDEGEYGKEYDVKGATISFRETGDRLDYENDEVYATIKEQLKEREALLKTAYKSKEMIYDSEGVEVPKVGVKTPSKRVVTIKY